MGSIRKRKGHKLVRVEGSSTSNFRISPSSAGAESVNSVRQLNGCHLFEQAGRDPLPIPVSIDLLANLHVLHKEKDRDNGRAHPGQGELDSRLLVKEKQGFSHRMDINSRSSKSDFSYLGGGGPQIDLFATWLSKRVPVFMSPVPDNRALAVDALSQSWEGMYAYAYPPISLIQRVIRKIAQESVTVVLIAPFWPRQPWFPDLIDILMDFPIRLPQRRDLISQPHNKMLHPSPEVLKLTAWKLSGNNLLRKDFQRQLQEGFHKQEESVLTRHTTIKLGFMSNGLMKEGLIPYWQI